MVGTGLEVSLGECGGAGATVRVTALPDTCVGTLLLGSCQSSEEGEVWVLEVGVVCASSEVEVGVVCV